MDLNALRRLARSPKEKAAGPDGVPPFLLSHLPSPQFRVYAEFVNAYLRDPRAPPALTATSVWLIAKKGRALDEATSWRPISLITAAYRLLSRHVVTLLQSTMAAPRYQHGFMQGRSTATATVALQERLANHGEVATVVDLEAAFDTVPWRAIPGALDDLGVPPRIINAVAGFYAPSRPELLGSPHQRRRRLLKMVAEVPQYVGIPQPGDKGPDVVR